MSTTLAVELKQIVHTIVDMVRGSKILSVIATGLQVSVEWLNILIRIHLFAE